jgi:S1-C subfamily serine protease
MEVGPDSAAYEAGLQTSNVILKIDNKPLTEAQDAVIGTAKRTDNNVVGNSRLLFLTNYDKAL